MPIPNLTREQRNAVVLYDQIVSIAALASITPDHDYLAALLQEEISRAREDDPETVFLRAALDLVNASR